MLWEWLVMPQGLKNAPATFNRCVTHLLRSVGDFAPSYFDDVYVHSRAVNEKTDVEMHKEHLRELLGLMRKHQLYANLKKCIFGASEIPVLGCLVGKNGSEDEPRSGSFSYSLETIGSTWFHRNVLMTDVPEMVKAYEAHHGLEV
ncbi:hypothetical protein PHMEG_00029674 [Phytophthora megakarya]|uniref:Reverse transcriptase domain-containing protein n=1 Tax=Phytophthora megakarya TaxID=4795 RepID=A0A225V2H2_9STRA|nr:hypothetical protein PHMEG_00029674 [Phytophthora megakarya]